MQKKKKGKKCSSLVY